MRQGTYCLDTLGHLMDGTVGMYLGCFAFCECQKAVVILMQNFVLSEIERCLSMSWDGWKSRVDNYKERPNQTSRSLFDIAIICQRIHCCDAYVRWKRKSTVGATWRRFIKTHQIKCMLGHTICTRAWYYSWTMQFGTRHTILAIREQTLVNIQNSRKIELRTTDKKPGRRFMFFCEKTYVHITSKTHHHSSLTIHHSICNRISDCLPSNPDNRLNCDYFMYRFFFCYFFSISCCIWTA